MDDLKKTKRRKKINDYIIYPKSNNKTESSGFVFVMYYLFEKYCTPITVQYYTTMEKKM